MTEYFVIVNGVQQGPMTRDALASLNITPETLVWRAGMPQWVPASQLPEIADIIVTTNRFARNPQYGQTNQFAQNPQYGQGQTGQYNPNQYGVNNPSGQSQNSQYQNGYNQNTYGQNGYNQNNYGQNQGGFTEKEEWFAMINDTRVGPHTISQLIVKGLRPDTPVWRTGMPDWMEASTQQEIMTAMSNRNPSGSAFVNNPQYEQNIDLGQTTAYQQGQNPQYGQSPQYNRNQPNNQIVTNWMPWAIAVTVVGFFTSCIGAIFGIIGIVNANKANTYFNYGDYENGNRSNSTAKTMVIIGAVLTVLGFFGTYFLLQNGLFNL